MNDAFQPFTASNPENESINLWSISRHRPTQLESGNVKFKYKFNKGYFAFQKSLFFSLVFHCLNLKSHQNLAGPIKMYIKLPIWNYPYIYLNCTVSKICSKACQSLVIIRKLPAKKEKAVKVLFWSALLVCDWLK